MAETSKRRPRKSKLVVRECLDLEDINNTSTEMQEEAIRIEASKTLLPKLKNAMNESPIDAPTTSVQFSVQVDVETCNDEDYCLNGERESTPEHFKPLVLDMEEIVISNKAIRNEFAKLLSSPDYIDKRLAIECCNTFAKPEPHVKDQHEIKLQAVLHTWKNWNCQSKVRSTVHTYKCTICSVGWWHLQPFREHIRKHTDISLRLDVSLHESSVTACQGQWYESVCLCHIEGYCPRCLRAYEDHIEFKKESPFYHCIACRERFPTCSALFEHEGLCVRFERIVYKNHIPAECMWACQICDVACLTQERYEQHMILGHSVRSDVPIVIPNLKDCALCGMKSPVFGWHACPKRAGNLKCDMCYKKFHTKMLLDLHYMSNRKGIVCKICDRFLKSRCMEAEHLLNHSEKFLWVYKCSECLDNVLLPSEAALRRHNKRHVTRQHKKPVPDICMEAEHLLKHGEKFLWVYKCSECLDNVLLPGEAALRRHNKRHVTRQHKKPVPDILFVPQSCIRSSWAQDVFVEDLFIDSDLRDSIKKGRIDSWKVVTDTIIILRFENLPEFMVARRRREEKNKVKIFPLSMLKRASVTANRKTTENLTEKSRNSSTDDNNDKIFNTFHRLKQEDDITVVKKEIVDDVTMNDNIKEEFDDDVLITDDDIMETQHSVDALLNHINIKDEDIEIEEPVWDQIVIDDSDDDSQPECQKSNQDNVNTKESSRVIVKEEPKDVDDLLESDSKEITSPERMDLEQYLQETDKKEKNTNSQEANQAIVTPKPESKLKTNECTNVNIKDETAIMNIKTEVDIKEETDDADYDNDIKEEQEACLEELSKVFRATNSTGVLELSGISSYEDVTKEDLLDDDDYEDDIIIIDTTKNIDSIEPAETPKTEETAKTQQQTTNVSENSDSDENLSQNDTNDKVSPEPYKKVLTNSGEVVVNRDKKIYRCKKCGFVGEHKNYKDHKALDCKRKNKKRKVCQLSSVSVWPELLCSLCNNKYKSMKRYFLHFRIHNLKYGRCPKCTLDFWDFDKAVSHLIAHVKNSFMKLHLLKASRCYSSKTTGLYQCKECQDKVVFKDFFAHWEKHLTIDPSACEPLAPLVVDAPAQGPAPRPPDHCQLQPQQIKILLEQLIRPFESRDRSHRCALCTRAFSRRNDVKRHVVEHLLRDAYTRGNTLTCQLCGQHADKPHAYKTHMRNHAALPVFRCDMCDKSFSDSSNFAKHKKVHNFHVLSECDLCKKKFHSKAGLERHMEMHASTRPMVCPVCARVCYSQSAYKKHLGSHEKKPFARVCRICMTRCSSSQAYCNHMWEVHRQRKHRADCPICQMAFRKIQDVRTHMREQHDSSPAQARALTRTHT